MDKVSTSMRDLSRRLLAVEAAVASANGEHEAERVCEKLRVALTRFAGAEGFLALMRRSLALARCEVPALDRLTLNADGCFSGLKETLDGDVHDAGGALTANLLSLLVTFVGEPLTLRLVRETWPDLVIDG